MKTALRDEIAVYWEGILFMRRHLHRFPGLRGEALDSSDTGQE